MWKAIIPCLIASVAATAIDTRLVARDDPCNPPESIGSTVIGSSSGGGPFCMTRWPSSNIITGIQTWSRQVSGKSSMCGIKLTYADGTTDFHGDGNDDEANNSGEMALKPGEFIKAGWMAGNGIGTRFGAFHFDTTMGGSYDLGKVQDGVKQFELTDVGTGILIAISGESGMEINDLQLHFLGGQIDHLEISNMQFTTKGGDQGLQTDTLAKQHYYNGGTSDASFEFSGGKTVSTSNSYSQTSTHTFGEDISVEATVGYKGIASVSAGSDTSWQDSTTTVTGTSKNETVDQHFDYKSTLKPGEGQDCYAWAASGNQDFPYTSDVILHLKDGQTVKWNEKGTMSAVANSDSGHSCVANNKPDLPAGYDQGTVTPDGNSDDSSNTQQNAVKNASKAKSDSATKTAATSSKNAATSSKAAESTSKAGITSKSATTTAQTTAKGTAATSSAAKQSKSHA